ncbi:hypothetical protein AYI68_g6929, partial [Smittium mucronatum]
MLSKVYISLLFLLRVSVSESSKDSRLSQKYGYPTYTYLDSQRYSSISGSNSFGKISSNNSPGKCQVRKTAKKCNPVNSGATSSDTKPQTITTGSSETDINIKPSSIEYNTASNTIPTKNFSLSRTSKASKASYISYTDQTSTSISIKSNDSVYINESKSNSALNGQKSSINSSDPSKNTQTQTTDSEYITNPNSSTTISKLGSVKLIPTAQDSNYLYSSASISSDCSVDEDGITICVVEPLISETETITQD